MKKLIAVLFLSALTFSCTENDNEGTCLEYADAPITEVTEIPAGDALAAKFEVEFTAINGCGEFGSFKSVNDGNTVTITAVAKYVGCVCDQALKQVEGVYDFNPGTPGTYTLKFRQANDTFITKEVIVE